MNRIRLLLLIICLLLNACTQTSDFKFKLEKRKEWTHWSTTNNGSYLLSSAWDDDRDSTKVDHYAGMQKILQLYQYAYRNLPVTRFSFPADLDYINYNNPSRYDLIFSAVNNQKNFDSLIVCLNNALELKTRRMEIDTTLYLMSLTEGKGVKNLNSDTIASNFRWHWDSNLMIKGAFSGKEFAECIRLYIKQCVELPSELENQFFEVNIFGYAKTDEEKIALLESHGISFEKTPQKVEFIQITNLCSDFGAHDQQFRFPSKQLKEDADYYFGNVENRHINPYYHVGEKEFNRRKANIYEQINTSMTKGEFSELMGTMNSALDGHTRISDFVYRKMALSNKLLKDRQELVFPKIKYKDGEILTVIDNKEVAINSINGKSVTLVISSITELLSHAPKPLFSLDMETFFSSLLPSMLDIHAPFEVKYTYQNQIQQTEIKGISLEESYYSYLCELDTAYSHPLQFKIYPNSSVAILYIHSFSENIGQEIWEPVMKSLLDSLYQLKIDNLFIDVSKNMGGNFEPLYHTFDFFRHDTLYMGVEKTETQPIESKFKKRVNKLLNILQIKTSIYQTVHKPYSQDIIRLANRDSALFAGKIFVLQGTRTNSCADLFCRIIRQNKLGVLIGQNTGQFTKTYIPAMTNRLTPFTQLEFSCAFGYWDFSHDCDTETLEPDIRWDTDYTFRFSEKELNEIMADISENGKNYI
jgi:hypothetical protein